MPDPTRKRKIRLSETSISKRAKAKHLLSSDLPWKTVSTPRQTDFGNGLDGFLELEEVDDVDIEYEETDAGRVVHFKRNEAREHVREPSGAGAQDPDIYPEPVIFDDKSLLPAWHAITLHPQLSRTLYAKGFTQPTPIQSQTLPFALKGRDVVGLAETGSGKTLAYGLPILHWLLSDAYARPIPSPKLRRSVRALILAPTRELALQVSSHLNACLNTTESATNASNTSHMQKMGKAKAPQSESRADEVKSKHPPLVSVAAVVGGMSAQKQRRILSRGVDVLVATPGRLWDLIQEDSELANQLEQLRFLVLDEADRMIETGHFAELDNILRLTLRAQDDTIDPENSLESQESASSDIKEGVKDGELQTFVFSATLSRDLQKNLKKRSRNQRKKNEKPASTLDDLILRLDFRDPEPVVVDINPVGNVVATLKESKVECLSTDKDAYLYYFLLRYPGRTLVFLSAIDGIRRLLPLLDLLGISAVPLHSQLEQRQRLKNLDRFKSTTNSVLLATDIAARGLDISAVDHVVHYQTPRTADAYIHRNGRTARAMRSGFSLLMCAPDERKVVRALMQGLGRQDEEIAEMPVDLYILDRVKTRIQLAREIDAFRHKEKKEKHERNWLKEAAEAMEIELDSSSASDDDLMEARSRQKHNTAIAKTVALKAQLKAMLAQPLIARGVSTRYITSGVRSVAVQMVAGGFHETMVGLKKTKAGEDLIPAKVRRITARAKAEEADEDEEWSGIVN